MRRLAVLSAVLSVSTSAFAQDPVDQAGATKLQDSLTAYVSKAAFEKGVIKIAPQGDSYKLSFDFQPIMSMIPDLKGITLNMSPYELSLKPRADANWDVSGPIFPNISVKGQLEEGQPPLTIFDIAIANGQFSGVLDTALAAFSSSQGAFDSMTVKAELPNDRSSTQYGKGEVTTTGVANPNGGVDATAKQTLRDYVETRQFEIPGSGTSFPLSIKSPVVTVDSSAKGIRTKAILDLVAFAVANPNEEAAKAKQEEFRGLLLAALPLWENLQGTQTMEGLNVASPVGTLNSSKIDALFSMDGLRDKGEIGFSLKMEEVKAASLFMPAWAPQFVPTFIDFKMRGDNINLDKPAREFIAALDMNNPDLVSEEVGEKIVAEMMLSLPRFLIDKSTIRTQLSEFTTQGEFTFDGGKPRYVGVIEAVNFDKTLDALQASAAQEPKLAEVVTGLQMAKGMSKTLENGAIQWNLRAEPDGAIFVNDTMVKPADAAPSALPDDSEGADDDASDDAADQATPAEDGADQNADDGAEPAQPGVVTPKN